MDLESFITKKEQELQKYKKIVLELESELNERLELEILKFYHKYELNNKTSLGEMFKTLSPKELKEFKKKAKEFYDKAKKENWEEKYINKLGIISTRKRINRLESVLIILENLIQSFLEFEKKQILYILNETYIDSYFNELYELSKKLNIGFKFDAPSKNLIYTAIFDDWTNNGNLFNLIDKNNFELIKTIRKEILIGISLGENPRIVARRITKTTDVLKHRANVVARTEMIRITNESGYASVRALEKKLGFSLMEKYSILATLDARTSKVCQEMDGKIFEFKDKKVGINFPPLHPNCRSTFKIVFDDDDEDDARERIARRLDNNEVEYVPANMNYKEWAKRFITNEKIKEKMKDL